MASPPPILAVSGAEELLRRRFYQGVLAEQEAGGWEILHVDGTSESELMDALTPPMFDDTAQNTLVVVDNPHKVSLELLTAYNKIKKPETVLFLHVKGEPDGRTKFAKWLNKLGKRHRSFPKPKVWDEEAVAATFCVAEAKRRGHTLKAALADALVGLVGTSLGFLVFEIQKMCILADIAESEALLPEHVKGGMASVSGAAMAPVRSALISRSSKRLMRSLGRIKSVSRSDPTMWVCQTVGPLALDWMGVAEMVAQGVSADDAAAQLRQNPWFYKNKLVPQVARWKPEDLVLLVKAVAESQRGVLRGSLDPWTALVARLLWVCG